MARKSLAPTIDFYQNNSKIKWILLVVSVVISISSIYYTKILVDQLKAREKQQVVLFAKAIEYTANAVEGSSQDINFVTQEILFLNNSIPIIQTHERVRPYFDYDFKDSSIDIEADNFDDIEKEHLDKASTALITAFNKCTGGSFDINDFYVFYSSRSGKISFHFEAKNVFMESNKEVHVIAKNAGILDLSPYSSFQNWRLAGSRKIGQMNMFLD